MMFARPLSFCIFSEANVMAVGLPFATSSAKVGPEMTAVLWREGISCLIVSENVFPVSGSRPLVAQINFCP